MAELLDVLSNCEPATQIDEDDTINIVRGGQLLKAQAQMFKGADGTDITSIPVGGETGQALVKKTDADMDVEWATIEVSSAGGTVIDLTDATADYALAVGDTAIIEYADAAIIPLHIATSEGEYRITLIAPTVSASTTTGDPAKLLPNNVEQSGILGAGYQVGLGTGAWNSWASPATYIPLGSSLLLFADFTLQIHPGLRHYSGESVYMFAPNTNFYRDIYTGIWYAQSEEWSSLGTIVLPDAQTGKIEVRRMS